MVVALGGETPDLHMNLGLLYKSVRENFKVGDGCPWIHHAVDAG